MKPTDDLEIEVFRAGDYGPKGAYTEEDLERIAADYDAAMHEAPVTLDHRQDGPAQGWIGGLRRMGDRLIARLVRLSEELREALRNGAYKKRSIELYRRFTETGRPYLKAVSFLGAAAPEVKSLRDPVFRAENGDVLRFDESHECTADSTEPPEPTEPETDPADEARQYLMARGVWRPEWEANGLPEVFRALAGNREFDLLLESLSASAPPVRFGAMATESPVVGESFAENLEGGASPGSVVRHRRAIELMSRHPSLGYRDALALVD